MNDVMNVEFNKALIGGQTRPRPAPTSRSMWEASLRKAGALA